MWVSRWLARSGVHALRLAKFLVVVVGGGNGGGGGGGDVWLLVMMAVAVLQC